ncbi:hypothetical protein ACPPVV_14785 [Rhodanobacter sp. Col0626]|uniref:hypothetical protein n=1 Tax=Rhodanobacter sp. Col0626 TaxID=3415679 RepID=UPI003CF899D1
MHRNILLASLAVLIAGSAPVLMAQSTPPPAPSAPHATAGKGMRLLSGDHAQAMHMHAFDRPDGGVIGNLHGLERLYMQAGRSKEMTSVYNDVLAKSQDPRVRDYVYTQLARLQAQPTNLDQAIGTLRKALDESLANEARMRTEREQMRATWQQRRSNRMAPVK